MSFLPKEPRRSWRLRRVMRFISWWVFCITIRLSGVPDIMSTFQNASILVLSTLRPRMVSHAILIHTLRSLVVIASALVKRLQRQLPRSWLLWFSNTTLLSMPMRKWRLRLMSMMSSRWSFQRLASSSPKGSLLPEILNLFELILN